MSRKQLLTYRRPSATLERRTLDTALLTALYNLARERSQRTSIFCSINTRGICFNETQTSREIVTKRSYPHTEFTSKAGNPVRHYGTATQLVTVSEVPHTETQFVTSTFSSDTFNAVSQTVDENVMRISQYIPLGITSLAM